MRILLISLLILTVGKSFGQKETSFGVIGGTNFSGKYYNYGSFMYGIYGNHKFNDKIGVQIELNRSMYYVGKNASHDQVFLNIPAIGKYYFWKGFNLQAGMQLGITQDRADNRVFYPQRKQTEFIGVAGIGYEFKYPIQVNFRMFQGFGDPSLIEGTNAQSSRYNQLTIGVPLLRKKK